MHGQDDRSQGDIQRCRRRREAVCVCVNAESSICHVYNIYMLWREGFEKSSLCGLFSVKSETSAQAKERERRAFIS